MSTSPVMSLTDELVTELEALYMAGWNASGEGWNAEYPGDAHEKPAFKSEMEESCGPVIAALLRERAEMQQQLRAAHISVDNCELFRKDAERYKYLCEASLIVGIGWDHDGHFSPDPKAELDAAVDKAMGATE